MSNHAELMAQLEALRLENEALKAKQAKAPGLTLKVSEKGCLSIYGLGRFPVSLYRSQAERLFTTEMVDKVQKFIAANDSALKVKE